MPKGKTEMWISDGTNSVKWEKRDIWKQEVQGLMLGPQTPQT